VAPFWRQIRLPQGPVGWAAKKSLDLIGPPPAPAADREDAWLEVHVVDVGQEDGTWIYTYDDNILHAYPGTRKGFGSGSTRENNASIVPTAE
jgi:hypothetical protein